MKNLSFKPSAVLKIDSSFKANSFLNRKQMRTLNFCSEFVNL